jgi:hypothetical protein
LDKNEQPNTLKPFMAASMAPVVAFILANVLFLPLVVAMTGSSNNFWSDILAPIKNPLASRIIAFVIMLFIPITGGIVLVSPPLTIYIVNRKRPILTTFRKAFWSGIVFFFFHSILLILLVVSRNSALTPLPPNFIYTRPSIDPILILGLLSGIFLSGCVTIFGWLGARKKKKKLLDPIDLYQQ